MMRINMKSLVKVLVIAVVLVAMSCKNDQAPNYQYMPNMYESVAYETYSEAPFKNGVEAQTPAEGSIARGHVPFEIENTAEGFQFAKETLKSPLDSTKVDFDKAKISFFTPRLVNQLANSTINNSAPPKYFI